MTNRFGAQSGSQVSGHLVPEAADSVYVAVSTTIAETGDGGVSALDADSIYVFVSTVDCFLLQDDEDDADAADGSSLVKAGLPWPIDTKLGARVSVLGLADDGHGTFTKMNLLR